MTHHYRVYGLSIRSASIIPALLETTQPDRSPDIRLSSGPASAPPDWVSAARHLAGSLIFVSPAHRDPADAVLRVSDFGNGAFTELLYADGCEFLLNREATQIWGGWPVALTAEDMATYLTGPILGLALRRRGCVPLHAGTVEVDGFAIAICGASGVGKSTTTAALALRGQPVLCEDVSPLLESGEEFSIPPGYPRICLWPESAHMLVGSTDGLPRITPTWEKRYLPLDGEKASFALDARLLAAVYFLEQRRATPLAPRVEGMTPKDAVLWLVQNSYMNRLLDKGQRACEFDVLSRLANRIPFRRVTPHSEKTGLGALCDTILQDAAEIITARRSMVRAGRA